MTDITLFVGLDVHKKTIAVALVDGAAGAAVRFFGTIANTPDTLRSLCKKLSNNNQPLQFCYEAGPCGYVVASQTTSSMPSPTNRRNSRSYSVRSTS
jgi:transposase